VAVKIIVPNRDRSGQRNVQQMRPPLTARTTPAEREGKAGAAAPHLQLKAQLADRHRLALAASIAVLALAWGLKLKPSGAVGGAWLPLDSLPPLCGSRLLLGVSCPGCGLTRSFVALASGDFSRSLEFHRLGWLVFGLTVAQLPYRAWRLSQLRRGILSDPSWPRLVGVGLLTALAVNWLVGNFS
jgi:hypothetical protein